MIVRSVFAASLLAGHTLLVACGGPSVQFDPAPAPAWLTDKPTSVATASLAATGVAPATLNVQHDQELALAAAKASIAQLFESQVKSSATDWSLSTGAGANNDQSLSSQSIEVRSNVKVEDVTVKASFRDEATQSHYVRIEVDRPAWTARLQGRLTSGLDELAQLAQRAEGELDAKRPLGCLSLALQGLAHGQKLEADIIVIDLLDPALGTRTRLLTQKRRLETALQSLKSIHAVYLAAKGPAAATDRFLRDARQFLNAQGFSTVDRPTNDVIRVEANLSQAELQQETVGTRLEYVHAARGSLVVKDADGTNMPMLAVDLGHDRYTERDADPKSAVRRAESLAGESLAALFRSAYRKSFANE